MAMDDIGKVNHRVKDDIGKVADRKEETIFNDFTARRNAIIKALTEDMCEFRNRCEQYVIPENEYLGLYGLPDGTWKVMLSGEVPLFLPHSKLYRLPNSEEDQNQWLAKVADDSDTWLFTVFFTYCSMSGYDEYGQSERLFNKINELPTIYEVVTGNVKNQEVATEKAKKRVEDKSTVSGTQKKRKAQVLK